MESSVSREEFLREVLMLAEQNQANDVHEGLCMTISRTRWRFRHRGLTLTKNQEGEINNDILGLYSTITLRGKKMISVKNCHGQEISVQEYTKFAAIAGYAMALDAEGTKKRIEYLKRMINKHTYLNGKV